MKWTPVAYAYDGSFAGFLSCVFESYLRREEPMCFSAPEEERISLYPERSVPTDAARARRVYASLAVRISPAGQALAARGFLTCLEERERLLYQFIRLGYQRGSALLRDLTDHRVAALHQAVRRLNEEAHKYTGFVRFSDQGGVLLAEIEPKNQVLPLLRGHFCARYNTEAFLIYDRTHRQVLLHDPRGLPGGENPGGRRWAILPAEDFRAGAPGEEERAWRALWRRFYDTIAIEGRENERCRRTHMPKRYWNCMTEFQSDGAEALPGAGAAGRALLSQAEEL